MGMHLKKEQVISNIYLTIAKHIIFGEPEQGAWSACGCLRISDSRLQDL